MWRVIAVCLALYLVLLYSCAGPGEADVAADFRALFEKEVGPDAVPVAISIAPGEGDGRNVYMHIDFDVLARKDAVFGAGWLEGIVIMEGARLSGGELVLLYQKPLDEEHWRLTSHRLMRRPSPAA